MAWPEFLCGILRARVAVNGPQRARRGIQRTRANPAIFGARPHVVFAHCGADASRDRRPNRHFVMGTELALKPRMPQPATRPTIERKITVMRGEKVILDADLAALYGVETKRLNEAVKRNRSRFPPDFAFQLTFAEQSRLTSQIVTSKKGRGGRRYPPWAFTEHGAIMAVLNSANAIEMSLYVVRAFVRLRELAGAHAFLAAKLAELEKRVTNHDSEIGEIIRMLRVLLQPAARTKRRIGYSGS
jgi:hypothetical protein